MSGSNGSFSVMLFLKTTSPDARGEERMYGNGMVQVQDVLEGADHDALGRRSRQGDQGTAHICRFRGGAENRRQRGYSPLPDDGYVERGSLPVQAKCGEKGATAESTQ